MKRYLFPLILCMITLNGFSQKKRLVLSNVGVDVHYNFYYNNIARSIEMMGRFSNFELNAGIDAYGIIDAGNFSSGSPEMYYGYHAGLSYLFHNKKNKYYLKAEFSSLNYQYSLTGDHKWRYNYDPSKDNYVFLYPVYKAKNRRISINPGAKWKLFSNLYFDMAAGITYIPENGRKVMIIDDATKYSDHWEFSPNIKLGFNYYFPCK